MKTFKKIHFRKGWWKSLLAAILCIGVIVGAGFGIASLVKPDKVDDFVTYTTLPVTKFRVGGLDGNGNYMNTDQSIYTKDAFECQGLNCMLAFDNDISYQIYFYDQNNEFVHTTGRLTGAFVQDSVPFFAKYARIVITPNDDNKVSKLEVMKYAKQLKTTVYREQGFKNYTEDLFEIGYEHASVTSATGAIDTSDANQTTAVSKYINVSSYKEGLLFRFGAGTDLHNTAIYFYDANHSYIGYNSIEGASVKIFMSSEGVDYYSIDFANISYITSSGDATRAVAYAVVCCSPINHVQVYCR